MSMRIDKKIQDEIEKRKIEHCLKIGMDKLQLTGRNMGRVFNFRNGRVHVVRFLCYGVKLPNLKLKTRPKQF